MSGSTSNKWVKPVVLVCGLVAVGGLLKVSGISEHLSQENIGALSARVESLGAWGPVVFVLLYVLGCLFFLPGLALTLLAGVFGVVMGTVYVSIASTSGAALSFLLARTALRPVVEKWVEGSPVFKKIDDGVQEHGWRMVMITRLVPVFPFNFQNYAYGLTKVRFGTYLLVSWICMLPGTVAYVTASGSIVSGQGDVKKTLLYLGVAAVFLVGLSLIPGVLKKKYHLAGTETEAAPTPLKSKDVL